MILLIGVRGNAKFDWRRTKEARLSTEVVVALVLLGQSNEESHYRSQNRRSGRSETERGTERGNKPTHRIVPGRPTAAISLAVLIPSHSTGTGRCHRTYIHLLYSQYLTLETYLVFLRTNILCHVNFPCRLPVVSRPTNV